MAPTLTLQFLTLVFFFFVVIGKGIIARDLKEELQDEKQNDANYMTQYRDPKPKYSASYTTKKHNNHISHPQKLTNSYITGYGASTEAHEVSQPNYFTGYRTQTHDSNGPYIIGYGKQEVNQPGYLTGYRPHTHDSNGPYITGYGKQGANQPDYITGYRTHSHEPTHDSNGPYITGYGKQEVNQPDYITGYRTHTHDSNGPYITGYGKEEANQPDYITGYRTHSHEPKKPYVTAYGNHETQQPELDGPYTTSYGKHEAKESGYITGYWTHMHGTKQPESNGPYKPSYGKHEAKELDYITGYRTHTHDTEQPGSNGPYITSYGGKHETKEPDYITGYRTHTHEPNGPYATAYGKPEVKKPATNSEDLEVSPPSILDHTEAFKTGFFNLDDVYVGNVMTLQFPVVEVSPYLSKKEADSIPLSMSQLPSVLQLYSIPEDSPQAISMRGTLEECEGETITGEIKICANSLESMLEFVDTIIGQDSKHNILTTSNPSPTAIPLQKYTILDVSNDIDAPKWVACHPLPYPYAIHYCHYISTGTKVFKVTLVGDENGDQMEALGVCHMDTSDWDPNHIIFKQLGIKAGKNSPVCHFFPVNHLLWVPQQPSKATM